MQTCKQALCRLRLPLVKLAKVHRYNTPRAGWANPRRGAGCNACFMHAHLTRLCQRCGSVRCLSCSTPKPAQPQGTTARSCLAAAAQAAPWRFLHEAWHQQVCDSLLLSLLRLLIYGRKDGPRWQTPNLYQQGDGKSRCMQSQVASRRYSLAGTCVWLSTATITMPLKTTSETQNLQSTPRITRSVGCKRSASWKVDKIANMASMRTQPLEL